MALPVIPNVFRATINFDFNAGVTAHNVLHFLSTTGDEASLAAALDDRFASNMLAGMVTGVGPNSYDIIKLDGTSAQQTFGAATVAVGAGGSDPIPASAAVINFRTDQRGPRGRGRAFIGPMGETAQTAGLVNSTTRTTMGTAWAAFFTGMRGEPGAWDGVVASYVHGDANSITTVGVREACGTLRRRQNQLV